MLLMVTTTKAQYEVSVLPKKENGYDVVGRSRWKENEDVGCSVVWLEVFLLLGKSVAEQ